MNIRQRTDFIVIHCTATPPTWDKGAKAIDAMHRQLGWSGIGYNLIIRRDGTPEQGRPDEAVGSHVAGWNSRSYGLSLVGGVDASNRPENNFTPAQWESLEVTVRGLVRRYPSAVVLGHRDFPRVAKACPCFDAVAWARSKGFPTPRTGSGGRLLIASADLATPDTPVEWHTEPPSDFA